MLIERSIFLPCPVSRCVAEVMTPRLLSYVASPMVSFVPLNPTEWPQQWEEKKYLVGMRLFGFIPLGSQTVNISVPSQGSQHLELRDNGYSGFIPKWDHLITIKGVEGGTLYTDRVEVQARLFTPFVWVFAWLFYRHRQRRWQKLVAGGFSYGQP